MVGIWERFLLPLLDGLLLFFPFPILGFHADNGSEYINHRVAALLDKLRVERFTKSRARHFKDNALVEGKNGNVVRKWFGHDHIPQRFAPDVGGLQFVGRRIADIQDDAHNVAMPERPPDPRAGRGNDRVPPQRVGRTYAAVDAAARLRRLPVGRDAWDGATGSELDGGSVVRALFRFV